MELLVWKERTCCEREIIIIVIRTVSTADMYCAAKLPLIELCTNENDFVLEHDIETLTKEGTHDDETFTHSLVIRDTHNCAKCFV